MLSDKEFFELLEKYECCHKKGDIVKGKICGFDGDNILVDINSKNYALCPIYEVLLSKGQNLKDFFTVGDESDFVINSEQDEDGIFYLSHKKVAIYNNLKLVEEKFQKNESVIGKVTNITKGGVIVNVMGLKGFVPSSQLRESDEEIDKELELKILSIDMTQNNFILSSRKVYSDSVETIKKEILDKIELNMVVKGEVVRITDFGAFVDIGGLDGLLPLSQISWNWIDNPSDVLEINQKIDVEIIGIDKEKQRVSLSLKSLEENPWLKAQDDVEEKKVIKGKITRIKPFGAFVEVYPKVEGLLNKQQMKEYFSRFNKELIEDEEIEVMIKKFDAQNQRIVLELP